MLLPLEVVALALLGQWSYSDAERRPRPPVRARAEAPAPRVAPAPPQPATVGPKLADLPDDAFVPRVDRVAERLTTDTPPAPMPEATTNATPVFEWRRFEANPAYEVWGHTDEAGIFRYTQFRLAAPAAPVFTQPVLVPQTAIFPAVPTFGTTTIGLPQVQPVGTIICLPGGS